jgi:hypothetical protein
MMVRRKGSGTAKRITVMLDSDIEKKLRQVQAKKLVDTEGSVSFSAVLNDVLRKTLKL